MFGKLHGFRFVTLTKKWLDECQMNFGTDVDLSMEGHLFLNPRK